MSNTKKLDKKTWAKIRPKLKNSYGLNSDWEEVIVLFKKRIDDFYFKPINSILKPNSMKGEGFAIVTLQCALIETFAAFKLGKIYNNKGSKNIPKYEYWSSGRFFVDFLHTEHIFQDHFFTIDSNGVKTIDYPYNAREFYERVRCGLMHEARTKDDWRITANPKKTGNNKFIGIDGNDKVIHRTILNDKLQDYFNNTYLAALKASSNEGNKLRRLLGRKLDHLHSLPKDTTYDWWLDR
ncbi:MAG: hypothetical protein KAX69_02095 [Chitinophagales bacterium]|nr:hypothetical protein [Chitinophagales bacterium]